MSVGRWLPRAAALAAIAAGGAAAVVGGVYLWKVMPETSLRALLPRPTVREPAPPVRPAGATERRSASPTVRPVVATGALRVDSTPTGARVFVDGKPRGVTPMTVADLPAGSHLVELESAEGRIRRSVSIAGGETATLSELIFAGWLAVYAPFEFTITEKGRSLRLDDRNQVMLPAGPHDLVVANRAFGYEAVHHVELKPGDVTTLSVTPPRSAITVTANQPAEVWLDGARVGDTPLSALPVDLGTHNVVLKRAGGGERRFTVTVTVQPLTLDVDFSKPGF